MATDNPDLRIRPIAPDEAESTAELIARVFPRDPSYIGLTSWYRWMLRHPWHRWDYVRVVELDGRIVSHLLIVERHIRLRTASVRCAGVSVVATLQEFQRRGLNRQLINEALNYASQQGFAISLLDGIPDYYDRYGYAVVMPKHEVRLNTVEALRLQPTVDVIEVESREATKWLPQLLRLYDEETAHVVGANARDESYWQWLLERGGKLVLATVGDMLEAYGWLGESPAVVEEAAGRSPEGVKSVVAAAAERAREAIEPELVFHIHPETPFARFLTLEFGGQVRVNYPRNAGWMGRILNLADVVRASLPGKTPERTRLCLETDLGGIEVLTGPRGLELRVGRCGAAGHRVEVRQQHLLQLVFGYAGAGELAAREELVADDATIETLELLFPKRIPGLFRKDHF